MSEPCFTMHTCLFQQYSSSDASSQGGAKFPTGGDSPRAPFGTFRKGPADTGESPGPTVKVRMEENQPPAPWACAAGIALGPLLKRKGWFHD